MPNDNDLPVPIDGVLVDAENDKTELVETQERIDALSSYPAHGQTFTTRVYDVFNKYTTKGFKFTADPQFRIKHRSFEDTSNNKRYKVTIKAPAMDRPGTKIKAKFRVGDSETCDIPNVWPSEQEEKMEEVLRDFYTQGQGICLREESEVGGFISTYITVTMYELQKRYNTLHNKSAKIKYPAMWESLNILSETMLEVEEYDTKTGQVITSKDTMITIPLSKGKDLENKRLAIRLHPLLMNEMQSLRHHGRNTSTAKEFKKMGAKNVYNLLMMRYRGATLKVKAGTNEPDNYRITLSTLAAAFRDEGESFASNTRYFKSVFDEMVSVGLLTSYDSKKRPDKDDPRKVDRLYRLYPSARFVSEMIQSHSHSRKMFAQLGYERRGAVIDSLSNWEEHDFQAMIEQDLENIAQQHNRRFDDSNPVAGKPGYTHQQRQPSLFNDDGAISDEDIPY